MTRRRIGGVLTSLLPALASALAWGVSPAAANDDYFFGLGGYEALYDDPVPAAQVNLLPVAIAAGPEYFAALESGDEVTLRCGAFAGRRGVKVTFEATLAVARTDNPEIIEEIPLRSARTKKNGWATFLEVFPRDSLEPVLSGPVVVAVDAAFSGNKGVEEARLDCSIGVAADCVPDATTACLQGGRFEVQNFWEDPFDGRLRESVVRSSNREMVRFGFTPLDTVEDRIVFLLDTCAAAQPPRSYRVDADADDDLGSRLVVTDTLTGVTRVYGTGPILDVKAFDTCP